MKVASSGSVDATKVAEDDIGDACDNVDALEVDDEAAVSFSLSSAASCTISLAFIMNASKSCKDSCMWVALPCADVSTVLRIPEMPEVVPFKAVSDSMLFEAIFDLDAAPFASHALL